MTPRILENPELKKKATQLLAHGNHQADVARELGVSPPTMCRFVKREDVQALIRQEAIQFAELLPDAMEMSRDVITAGKREAAEERPGVIVDGSMRVLPTSIRVV